jgi:YidC/Oxa1 family membrane protein insertase
VAPQIKVINEKYKKYKLNDPKQQEKNQEIMGLYKKHGINPVGGCLPIVLQIPFLYGFYKVLSLCIEMRHAPWILWVQDLSVPETHWFKVLPVLMIVTTVVLQKMTPQTSTDPVQQKMFMLMPLMFGVMFYNVSSGLVLYWLVGNLVQIGQQWYINKTGIREKEAG